MEHATCDASELTLLGYVIEITFYLFLSDSIDTMAAASASSPRRAARPAHRPLMAEEPEEESCKKYVILTTCPLDKKDKYSIERHLTLKLFSENVGRAHKSLATLVKDCEALHINLANNDEKVYYARVLDEIEQADNYFVILKMRHSEKMLKENMEQYKAHNMIKDILNTSNEEEFLTALTARYLPSVKTGAQKAGRKFNMWCCSAGDPQ